MANGQRVLVVDGITETEEVLRAVLEPRGLLVERFCGRPSGDSENPSTHANVVVLHTDDLPRSGTLPVQRWGNTPCVVIGSAHIPTSDSSNHRSHYLRKPFCYRELIGAIERLLDQPAR